MTTAKIITYRHGSTPAAELTVNASSFGADSARRDNVLRALQRNSFTVPISSPEQILDKVAGLPDERFVRVDAVTETDFYVCGPHGATDILFVYHQPMPSAALSLELAVDLHYVGKRHWNTSLGGGQFAGTCNLLCRSHEERLRMAEYLAYSKGGLVEIDGEMYDVVAIRLVDRTLVYGSRRQLQRSSIGSPVPLDHAFTEALRPVMDELAPTEIKVETFGFSMVDPFAGAAVIVDGVQVTERKVY